MKTTYHYLDQIKDQYGNLLASWGVYEKTIILENVGEKPIMSVKILKQFESVKDAQRHLDKLLGINE
jgi:ABC-type histidine transport system ATPase subunit